jgi:adenylate cyclase
MTRHHVQIHGRHWEIDEFHGVNAPLVIAEIELTHPDEHVDPPLWLGEEVTDQRRYYNSELVHQPYSSWSTP